MERRIILATFLSLGVLIIWSLIFYTPKPRQITKEEKTTEEIKPTERIYPGDVAYENESLRAVFNSETSGLTNYYVKEGADEKNWPDLVIKPLVLSGPIMDIKYTSKVVEDGVNFSGKHNGLEINKKFKLSNNFFNSLNINLKNNTTNEKELNLEMSWNAELGGEVDPGIRTEVIGYDKILKNLKPGKHDLSNYKWIGLHNRSFLLAFLPEKNQELIFEKHKKDITFKIITKTTMGPKSSTEFNYNFYLGPKKYDLLKSQKIGLENSIQYGLFAPLSRLAVMLLKSFYRITGNYGLSIILLSLLSQVFLFPLSLQNLKSMEKMRSIQPKLRLLQKAYSSDPKRLQEETFKLYRSHKINPFGGCLPLLLQLPVFWALFTALSNTYELRKARFILWITDLSTKDPYYILPIMMGITMFLQQKFFSPQLDQQQKFMMYFMPILFVIITLNFPSGLVLYWFTNNLFMILTQIIFPIRTIQK